VKTCLYNKVIKLSITGTAVVVHSFASNILLVFVIIDIIHCVCSSYHLIVTSKVLLPHSAMIKQ